MWATMMLLAAGLAGVVENTALRLELVPTKKKILVGEPLKVKVVWSASRSASQPIAVNLESVKLMIDDGTGFKQHVETQTMTRSVIQGPSYLAAGESRVTAHVLSVTGGGMPPERASFRFAFPLPGRYRLMAYYFGVKSDVVVMEATHPEGKDADLFARHLRSRPEMLTEWALMNLRTSEDAELAAKLLDEYRGSPYLGPLQLLSWKQELADSVRTHHELHGRGRSPLDGEPGGALERIATEIFDGPFDDDRLAMVARTKLEWGDREGGMKILRQIVERYPRGPAADEARALLTDMEPQPEKQ